MSNAAHYALSVAIMAAEAGPFVDAAARYGARRLLEGAGHEVAEASSGEEMLAVTAKRDFDVLLLDHQMEGMSGLEALHALQERSGAPPVVFFTAQGSERVAVEAMRRGAFDYLSKPADADDITAALLAAPGSKPKPPENPMSADRVRWEHIQRVYELCGHNVSETARRLNMHRRTLQRILAKRSPR